MEQFRIHLTRSDPGRNIHRYYELSLDETLLGDLVVTRRWGRIGSLGKLRQERVDTKMKGLEALLCTLKSKLHRGYGQRRAV